VKYNLRRKKLNKKILTVAMFSCMSVASASAIADNTNKTYFGAQYAIGTYSEDGFDDVNPTALVGRFGKYFNDNFALEGRLGIGIQDDSINIFGTDVTLEIDTILGIYGIGHFNLNETSSVYGLLGLTRAEATVSASGFGSDSDDETGLSFGVGADIGVSETVALNIEYTQYLNKSDFDFSALSFGAVFSF